MVEFQRDFCLDKMRERPFIPRSRYNEGLCMANLTSKIDKLGLGPRVQALITDGISGGKQIGEILRKEGHDIADNTVYRYLSKVKDKIAEQAFEHIQKHVDLVVPDDLKALEEMESKALEWFREAEIDVSQRVAEASAEIEGELEAWRAALTDAENPKLTIKWIIKECTALLTSKEGSVVN